MDTRHRIRKMNKKNNKKKQQQQQQKGSINNNNNNKFKNKKQKKSNDSIIINLEYSSSSSSTKDISCHDDHEFPNWLDLPTSLLHYILDLISSLPDLFAFSTVCTQWRSLAKYTTHHLFPPPLLLYTLNPSSSSSSSSLRTSPLLHLKTLNKSSTSTTFPSMVSKRDLYSRNLVGYSHGYLIFAAEERVLDSGVYFHCHVLIVDIFSGRESRPPKLVNCVQARQAILTAPLSSQSCKLLLTAYGIEPKYSIYCCDLGANDDHWSLVQIGPRSYVDSLLVFRSQLFAILRNNCVLVFESIPPTSFKRVNVPLPDPPIAYIYRRYLIECNGELLLLLLTQCHDPPRLLKFEVYRFDCQNFVWVMTNSIGDWCLFLNSYGLNRYGLNSYGLGLLACPYPTRWGGKSNRIYVAKCGTDTLTQIPLDGSLFDWNHITCGEVMPPIFVYPRKIKSETFSINFSKGM